MEIIGVIIAGIIIGLLGKFVAPSTRDNIPIWLTILCGIGGVHHRLVHLYPVRWQREPRDRLDPLAHCDRGCCGLGDRRRCDHGPQQVAAHYRSSPNDLVPTSFHALTPHVTR